VTAAAATDPVPMGTIVLAWAALAAAMAWFASTRRASSVALAAGVAAVALYLTGVPIALQDAPSRDLLNTLAYAAGALALGLAQLARRSSGAWSAALALAAAAALRAILV